MRRRLTIAALAVLTVVGTAQTRPKPKPLDDAALDRITAGGTDGKTVSAGGITAGLSNGAVQFQGQVPTKNGLVSAAGTMAFQGGPKTANTVTSTTTGTLNLSDNAQQNLNSLVNITAVNSNISVLLNLNVNINSTVGTVTQSNLSKH